MNEVRNVVFIQLKHVRRHASGILVASHTTMPADNMTILDMKEAALSWSTICPAASLLAAKAIRFDDKMEMTVVLMGKVVSVEDLKRASSEGPWWM